VIYPDPGSRIYIPYEYDGNKGRVVFEATHRKSSSSLYWSVDDEYKGKTTRFHKMEMIIPGGDHILTLTDEDGNQARVAFTILEKDLQ
jgi:penicillin-binding protein 1C